MIYYLCDEKACENCSGKAHGCMLTSDISHAVNFKKNEFGDFIEQPALLEAKDSFTDLVKELNILLDNYKNIKGLSRQFMFTDFAELKERFEKLEKAIELSIFCISEKIEKEVRGEREGLTVKCTVDPKLMKELLEKEAENAKRDLQRETRIKGSV